MDEIKKTDMLLSLHKYFLDLDFKLCELLDDIDYDKYEIAYDFLDKSEELFKKTIANE